MNQTALPCSFSPVSHDAQTTGEGRVQYFGAGRWSGVGVAILAAALLAGCGSRGGMAPVEDRGTGMSRQGAGAVDPGNVKQLPGFENAGKPGY